MVELSQRYTRSRPFSTCSMEVTGGCSTDFGAGNTNRCACSRHASRSARRSAMTARNSAIKASVAGQLLGRQMKINQLSLQEVGRCRLAKNSFGK